MDLSLLQTARFNHNTCRVECNAADQSVRHLSGVDSGSGCAGQWDSKEVSQILRISRAHAFQQLLHDYHLSDAVALPGIHVDLGSVDRDCFVRVAGVVNFTFWVDAIAEVRGLHLKVAGCKLAGIG